MVKGIFFKGTAFVLCLSAVLFFTGHLSMQKKRQEQALPPAIKFKMFRSTNPAFNFSFEYPDVWRIQERGYQGDYDMVEVLGTSHKSTPLVPGIFITKRILADGGTSQGLMDAWLKTESRYKNFRVLSSKDVAVSGQKALETEYTYVLSLPLWDSSSGDVSVKKEQIVMIKNKASFEVTFMGTKEQFKSYKPIFRHVLETFKFSEP